MRKVIAAFNMTLDGVYDHTAGLPDEAIHEHYTTLLSQGMPFCMAKQLINSWNSGGHSWQILQKKNL